jgi:hypothetical protein
MGSREPFLDRLGLGQDADERAVRRAYARELKLIDPEADLAGYQTLQEAYRAAIDWCGQEGNGSGFESQASMPASSPVDTADWGEPDPGLAIQPAAAPVDVHDSTTYSISDGAAVFAECLARLAPEVWCIPRSDEATLRELRRALNDPRLVPLAARLQFEQCLADYLTGEWHPGQNQLLEQGNTVFGWSRDHRSLERLGQSGREVERIMDNYTEGSNPSRLERPISMQDLSPTEPMEDQNKKLLFVMLLLLFIVLVYMLLNTQNHQDTPYGEPFNWEKLPKAPPSPYRSRMDSRVPLSGKLHHPDGQEPARPVWLLQLG